MTDKKVADLVRGDRVVMDGGAVRIVHQVTKGFARYRKLDGTSEGSLLIDWKDGDWTQCPASEIATLAPARKAPGRKKAPA